MARFRQIVVLTGAGISAESGLATFRDRDGLWNKVDIEAVATPEAFRRDPAFVHDFHNGLRRAVRAVQPNAAHRALAELERRHGPATAIVPAYVEGLLAG